MLRVPQNSLANRVVVIGESSLRPSLVDANIPSLLVELWETSELRLKFLTNLLFPGWRHTFYVAWLSRALKRFDSSEIRQCWSLRVTPAVPTSAVQATCPDRHLVRCSSFRARSTVWMHVVPRLIPQVSIEPAVIDIVNLEASLARRVTARAWYLTLTPLKADLCKRCVEAHQMQEDQSADCQSLVSGR